MWWMMCAAALAGGFEEYEEHTLYTAAEVDDPALAESARAVVRLATGSGFVTAPSGLVLTSHHIAEVVGPHTWGLVGWSEHGTPVRSVSLELVRALPQVDAALYRIAGQDVPPGLPLRAEPTRPGETVAMVGHPGELPVRFSFGPVLVGQARINGMGVTEYDTGAMLGSSGSALVDESGQVVAIHQGWDMTHVFHGALVGIRMDAILEEAPELLRGDGG